MRDEQVVDQTTGMATRTSRRTIVRTGAKLAYAAPLVAASLPLTASSSEALSGMCIPLNADCTGHRSSDCCGDLACRRVVGSGGTMRTCRP